MGAVLLTEKSAAAQFVKCAAILAIYYVRTPPYFGNILRVYPSLLWQYTTYVPLPISAINYIRTSLPAGGYYCNIQRSASLLLLKYTDQAPSDVCKIHQRGVRLWHCKERTEIECQCAKLHNIAMCQLCQCKPV